MSTEPSRNSSIPWLACACILGLFYLFGKDKERNTPNFSMMAVGSDAIAVLNTATGDVSVLTARGGQLVRVYEAGIASRWGDKAKFDPETAKASK